MSKIPHAIVAALSEEELHKAYREFSEYDHSPYKHPWLPDGGVVMRVMREADLLHQSKYVREVFFKEMAKRHYGEKKTGEGA